MPGGVPPPPGVICLWAALGGGGVRYTPGQAAPSCSPPIYFRSVAPAVGQGKGRDSKAVPLFSSFRCEIKRCKDEVPGPAFLLYTHSAMDAGSFPCQQSPGEPRTQGHGVTQGGGLGAQQLGHKQFRTRREAGKAAKKYSLG